MRLSNTVVKCCCSYGDYIERWIHAMVEHERLPTLLSTMTTASSLMLKTLSSTLQEMRSHQGVDWSRSCCLGRLVHDTANCELRRRGWKCKQQ